MEEEQPKQIQVKCSGSGFVSIDELQVMQGALKHLSEENYQKLRARILKQGFSFPFFVWVNEGINWVLDGTQRTTGLKRMRDEEGYIVPLLPIVHIEAENQKEAAEKLLSAASQFGEVTSEGLAEFVKKFELGTTFVVDAFHFPDIDMAAWAQTFKEVTVKEHLRTLPELPKDQKPEFEQITFTLHNEQAEQVRKAMEVANGLGDYETKNENSNGNAIARVCSIFLGQNGKS